MSLLDSISSTVTGSALANNVGISKISSVTYTQTGTSLQSIYKAVSGSTTSAITLFTSVTTNTSCGAVVAAHGSLTPIGGMIALINMLLNEIIFGGVGSGLYGMLLFIILSVFIAGLMWW